MVLYQRDKITINHEYECSVDLNAGHVHKLVYTPSKPNKNIDDFELYHFALALINLAFDMRAQPSDVSERVRKEFNERLKIRMSPINKQAKNKFGVVVNCPTDQYNVLLVYNAAPRRYYTVVLDGAVPAFVQIMPYDDPVKLSRVYDLRTNYLFNTLCTEVIYLATF